MAHIAINYNEEYKKDVYLHVYNAIKFNISIVVKYKSGNLYTDSIK